MKRRIEQLVNGIYEYKAPEIHFSAERIDEKVRLGENFYGSFTMKNSEQRRIKGFLYSSDARVACEPGEFSGIEPRISFDVDFCGMKEGDVLEGAFTACTNMGEKTLPYRFEIIKRRVQTPEGTPLDLESFAAYAKENYLKAYTVFRSADFAGMLWEKYPQHVALYQGLISQALDCSVLEEFLIGAGLKEPVSFALKHQKRTFEDISESIQESFEITRTGWGFRKLQVSSDAAFLIPAHVEITTDDFLGSSFSMEYRIDAGKLHGGCNCGRITVKSSVQELSFEVTVRKKADIEREKNLLKQRRQIERLYKDYLDFRLKRISIHTWIARAEEALAKYEQAGGRNVMMMLYRAHIYFAADQSKEACTLLDSLEKNKLIPKLPSVQGYYEYLTTFYDKDPAYVDFVEEKIKELYLKNQEEWFLQWILLYLQQNLIQHPTQKLEAIRRQYVRGCRSRLMYLEAYYVVLKAPLLLKKLDEFELQVLRFLCRNDLLNREIVMQVADLAGRVRGYDQELYKILLYCYAKHPSRSVINAICSLLIKGHKIGPAYFNWYEKGVAEGLRLTGLYEYYIESMGKERRGLLPRMVRMYFSYDNAVLNYEKKAVLYANIIENKEKDARTYNNCRPAMEKFMVDQLMAGHVNRELACIYREFLNKSMMNRRMAENLSRALFTCEVRCESGRAAAVAVVHRQLDGVQRVSLTDHTAKVQIYTEDACVFVIDHEGVWHAGTIPCTVTRLLDAERMFSMCRELAPESPGFLLYFCSRAQNRKQISGDKMGDFCGLLEFVDVQESYKQQIRQDILDYYYNNPKDESLYEYLHIIDLDAFIATDKKKTIELLTAEGMCKEAFALVCKYGPENVGLGAMVRLCSRNILEREREDDDMLLYLCWYCFSHGKYDETVLTYLLSGYDGPVESMKRLWRACRKFELDTFVLEEKILIMLLFVREGLKDSEEIFESYRRRLGKKLLLTGYLNLMSYEYFVRKHPVGEPVFTELVRRMERGQRLDMACRLALLWHDSLCGEKTEAQQERMSRILEECKQDNRCFAFFENLEPALLRKMQLQDRRFIEYRTNPEAKVVLRYVIENLDGEKQQERTEMMPNVYEGIFVKDFTLFYGERLIYTITEECNGAVIRREEQILTAKVHPEDDFETRSRYRMLNEMCEALADHRESQVKSRAKQYLEQEALVEKLFPLME